MMTTIESLEVTHYPHSSDNYQTEILLRPSWEQVTDEIRSMHRAEKPIVWLLQHQNVSDADVTAITGGQGVYHIPIADAESRWRQAVKLSGAEDIVEVWTSDQGFETAEKYTWSLADTLQMAQFYFDQGESDSQYTWEW